MGTYTESLISYLAKNEDTHEYVLFCNDSEADEFIKISYPFRVIKTTARVGSFKEQTILPYQLYKEKLDLVFFPQPNIPLGYWQKSIVVLSDLVPYFYPDRYKK